MTRAEAAEVGLRKVAGMPCVRGTWLREGVDCRQAEREAMGGCIPEEEQRRWWCPRCVAADALEHLPE